MAGVDEAEFRDEGEKLGFDNFFPGGMIVSVVLFGNERIKFVQMLVFIGIQDQVRFVADPFGYFRFEDKGEVGHEIETIQQVIA